MWNSSILPVVPGLRLAAPRDCARLRELLREAVDIADGPTVIRYPKATAGPDIPAIGRIGQCDILRDEPGAQGLLVAVGPLAAPCLAAAGADTCAATFALPPQFLPHASREQILRAHGLDATTVLKRLASTHRGKVTSKEI